LSGGISLGNNKKERRGEGGYAFFIWLNTHHEKKVKLLRCMEMLKQGISAYEREKYQKKDKPFA